MQLRSATLSSGMDTIPIHVKEHGNMTLLRCHDVKRFIGFLYKLNVPPLGLKVSNSWIIEGVISQKRGACFQLRDEFGAVTADFARLPYTMAEPEILQKIC